ncbi:MAG TPA: tetratricopeptide repeat protein [Chthoniobacterales bacterium]
MAPLINPTRKRLAVRNLPLSALIFLGVFLLRLVVLVRLTDSQFLLPDAGDMRFYNDWALRILRGEWTTHMAFYGLPLYAYLLAAFYKIAGYSPFIPGLVQAALEGGTAVLLYRISGAVFGSASAPEAHAGVVAGGADLGMATPQDLRGRGQRPRLQGAQIIGLLAAIGWAFFQPAEAYSVILMPTSWLVFIFWFVIWQVVKRNQAPTYLRLALLGGLIGFTAMGIATVLFLVPLLVAAIFLKRPAPPSRRFIGSALIAGGVLVGTSPAWLHNCFVARDPVFLSAHSGVNFWIGNNPVATGYPRFPPGLHAGQEAMLRDSITTAEKRVGRPLKRSEVSAFWSAQAAAWIRQHPDAWLRLLAIKTKNFWNGFQYDDLSIITALREERIIFPGIGFGIIAALGLAGALIACRDFPGARWIAAALLLHLASLLPVFVTERYRLAAVPGLLLFGAFGVWELWQHVSAGRLRSVALYLALLLGAIGFVSLPQKDPTLWSLDTYNAGIRALANGNLPVARQKLDRAYGYSRFNAGTNFAEGNLHFAEGDLAGAKQFYESTLRLDPQHSGAWNNLGVIALKENRWKIAAACFDRVLEGNQSGGKTFYLLAEAQFRAGNLLAADTAITRALALDPSQPEFRTLADRIAIASNIPPLP